MIRINRVSEVSVGEIITVNYFRFPARYKITETHPDHCIAVYLGDTPLKYPSAPPIRLVNEDLKKIPFYKDPIDIFNKELKELLE